MAAQPAQLVAVSEGPNILLDKPILLIGRHQECDIQIPSRKISRRHCCIAQVDDYLVVRDLCSTNGIRINGVRVNEGHLKSGDELTIGNFRYQVNWPIGPGLPAPAPAKGPAKPTALEAKNPFDSCEEPVPLAEPEGSHKIPSGRPNGVPPPVALGFAEGMPPRSDSQLNNPK